MQTFNIGRKGDQNFALEKREKVSDIHARLTIDDQGRWLLEDLDSVNGTFIVNDNGELTEIRKKQITEYTRIVLADTTAMGYSFYAHHLLESNPGDYHCEFRHLIHEYNNMKAHKEELESNLKTRRMLLSLLPVIVSCVAGVALRAIFHSNPNIIYLVIGMMSAVTAVLNVLVTWYVNKDQSLKNYSLKMQRLTTCPCCGRVLSDYDISNQMCPACKAHA